MTLLMKLNDLSNNQKQVITLYFSTLFGTILGVLSSIINTRALDPVGYGDVRYVQNIINFIASLLLFGYFLSGSRLLAITDSKEHRREIRGVMVIILFVASCVLIICTLICAILHIKHSTGYLFLIALPVCINPLLNNYLNTTAQGDNYIGRLSMTRLLPNFIYVPLAYIIYKHFYPTPSLMIILQWGVYTIIYLSIVISTKPKFSNIKSNLSKLQQENRDYGIQLYWGSLIMLSSNYLAGISLGTFSQDNTNVGYYTLALTVTTPLQMLPSIIGTTYFRQFAKLQQIPPKVLMVTFTITIVSCFIFILLIGHIVTFLYPASFSVVGVYSSWLACGFSLHGLGDIFNRYLGSHGQGRQIRNSSFFCGLSKIVGFTIFVFYFGIKGAIASMLVSSVIYAISMMYYYFNYVKRND